MNFAEWLNDNLIIAGIIGIALGIVAKYVVRGIKANKEK